MNEYLIYTQQGITEAPKFDIDVNNCQVLGRATGENLLDAIDQLFLENIWIENAGFKKSECMGVQLLTSSQKEDINKVIDYLWEKEQIHYKECGHPDDHMFCSLLRLRAMSK